MSKKFLTENDRLENLKKRGQLIKESFQKEFNKIKRLDEAELSDEELDALAKEDEEYENQATRANLKETMYNEGGQIEIKPKDDARCPDGRCQMYDLYYNGDAIYEFGSTSFKTTSLKDVAKHIFDTYNQSSYDINLDTSIEIAKKIFQTIGRGEESGEQVFQEGDEGQREEAQISMGLPGASGHLHYKGGDGVTNRPENWVHLKGSYTVNNGRYGWITNDGDLFSAPIPNDAVANEQIKNHFSKFGYKNDGSVPVIT